MKKIFTLATLCFFTLSCSQEQPNSDRASTPSNSEPSPREQRMATVESEIERLLPQLTLEEKISLLHASGKFYVNAIERLGIHEMWLSDGPHGVRYEMIRHGWARDPERTDDFTTYLPPLTTVAASWNPKMAELHGNVLGAEARERNKDIILGPGINLARLPLYGRNFEYMGEDPYLAATLVVPEVQAIQANDVAASVKHYALNTQELNRTAVDARPDERTLREVYLPAFEASVVEGGAWTVMGGYNRYMGTNANQSKHLVMDILKGDWGFKGILLTDWGVDINTYDAAMNGLDLEMGTRTDDYNEYFLAGPLLAMVKEGKVPESVIDDKVRRILRVQLSIGMMDKHRLSGERNTIQHQQDALTIAEEGIVLLKNNNKLLPLDKSIKNILVMGPNADKEHGLGGGSSEVPALYEVTPLEGLKAKLGEDVNITVMRARDESILNPIAPDYVISRHWTGTPAWTLARFADAAHSDALGGSAVVDSEYQTPEGAQEYVTMTATIRPLTSGAHLLKAQALGDFDLKIDGNTVLAFNSDDGETIKREVQLEADKEYTFEISYSGNQRFTLGWDAPGNLFTPEADYLAAAKAADAVIYFGGLSHGDDREAIDRPDMKLPFQQDAIIDKLLGANPNTVVFIIGASAVEMPWVDRANAIAWGWYGGMESGNAFANMLFGDINPGGKMPITLPHKLEHTSAIMSNDYNAKESTYPEGVFIGYRWFEKQNIEPMFPFGHGLSYTEFEYSDLKFSSSNMKAGATLDVSVTVKNTGDRAGAEVVQLYLGDKEASVERPAKELKGFGKIWLEPGQSQSVTMTLDQRDLSFWDVESNNWKAEAGEFEVHIGASVSDIRLSDSFQYQ